MESATYKTLEINSKARYIYISTGLIRKIKLDEPVHGRLSVMA
jgi:hypothetical protein